LNKLLILVKHSLPDVVENIPAREWVLSKHGRERARRLAQCLVRYQPEMIVSSDEPKAKETAEIIAKVHGLEFQVCRDLYEHDRSKAPFLSKEEFRATVREFFEKPNLLVFGNETADQCHARFDLAVRSVLNAHENKTIMIVAHGTVISLFVSRLTGVSDFLLWEELGLPSFVVIDIQSDVLIETVNIS